VDGQSDTSPPSATRCKDIARAHVTNWEPQCVTLAGYSYVTCNVTALRYAVTLQVCTHLNCNGDYVFVWEVLCSVMYPLTKLYCLTTVQFSSQWRPTPIIQLWSIALPWTNTSRRLQFLPEMFNAMLKESQIRMTWCDKDSPIICTINGYKNSLWNETGPVGNHVHKRVGCSLLNAFNQKSEW